jgi:hypothetical protein
MVPGGGPRHLSERCGVFKTVVSDLEVNGTPAETYPAPLQYVLDLLMTAKFPPESVENKENKNNSRLGLPDTFVRDVAIPLVVPSPRKNHICYSLKSLGGPDEDDAAARTRLHRQTFSSKYLIPILL